MKRKKTKKWGKIGAPKSAKRKAFLKKIRKGVSALEIMVLLAIAAAVCCLVTSLAGCTIEQQEQLVDTASAAQPAIDTLAAGGQAILESPAVILIPEPVKSVAGIAILCLSGISNVLQALSKRKTAKTLSVVTQAVEASPGAEIVKTAVKSGLEKAGIYQQGKAIISAAKNG